MYLKSLEELYNRLYNANEELKRTKYYEGNKQKSTRRVNSRYYDRNARKEIYEQWRKNSARQKQRGTISSNYISKALEIVTNELNEDSQEKYSLKDEAENRKNLINEIGKAKNFEGFNNWKYTDKLMQHDLELIHKMTKGKKDLDNKRKKALVIIDLPSAGKSTGNLKTFMKENNAIEFDNDIAKGVHSLTNY